MGGDKLVLVLPQEQWCRWRSRCRGCLVLPPRSRDRSGRDRERGAYESFLSSSPETKNRFKFEMAYVIVTNEQWT